MPLSKEKMAEYRKTDTYKATKNRKRDEEREAKRMEHAALFFRLEYLEMLMKRSIRCNNVVKKGLYVGTDAMYRDPHWEEEFTRLFHENNKVEDFIGRRRETTVLAAREKVASLEQLMGVGLPVIGLGESPDK